MAGHQKPRIPTMRLLRPYETEEALIEGDFASLGRPWIVLPDVPVVPVGELVRFEVLLSTGAPAIRGEGLVVAYHGPGEPKPPGLEIKFTRMDARTKSIIERVHAKRLALRMASTPPPTPPPPPPAQAREAAPPAPAAAPEEAPKAEPAQAEPTQAQPPQAEPPQAEAPKTATEPRRKIAAPPNRDEILERLRARGRQLPPEKRFERSRGA
jgi:hypothetical protein